MTTTVNFNFSPTMQASLGTGGSGNGVYVWAVAFDGKTGVLLPGSIQSLWSNGTVQTTNISLPSPNFDAGVVYVIVEQAGAGNPSKINADNLLNSQSQISYTNAQSGQYNFTYQLFETTLGGGTGDLGDISSVGSFGLASSMEVVFNPGPSQTTDTRGFQSNGSVIFNGMNSLTTQGVQTFSPNLFANANALALGPAPVAINPGPPWDSSQWTQYITNLKTYSRLGEIQIVDFTTAITSQYGLEYVAADPTYGNDFFWLKPNTSNGATNTDWMRIPAADLATAIWEDGQVNLEVHVGGKDGPIQTSVNNFTPDTANGNIARDLISGLNAGYIGATASSPNPAITSQISLDQSWNWTANYSYAASLNPTGPLNYSNALNTGGAGNIYYDPYAQLIRSQSNAYGYTFSDFLSRGSTNPQIAMWDPVLKTNVQQINITLYDTNEPPSNLTGYKPYTVPYTPPPPGGYHSVLTPSNTTGQSSFGNLLEFSFVSGIWTPNQNTPINFRFYAPDSAQAGSDGFVSLDVSAAVDGSGNNYSAWFNYNVVNTPGANGGTWSLQPFTQNVLGSIDIYGVPVTGDGTTSWYQLAYGAPGAQTLFNFYAETNAAQNNVFTSIVADYAVLTQNSGPQGTAQSSFLLNFFNTGLPSMDIGTYNPPHTVGDLNNDARADLIFQSSDVNGDMAAWLMNGLVYGQTGGLPAAGAGWKLGAIGDINDDGDADLVFQAPDNQVALWYMDGLTLGPTGLVGQTSAGFELKATADLDGDGRSELIFENSAPPPSLNGHGVAVWHMNGLTPGPSGIVTGQSNGWDLKATGDVNGDWKTDLILQSRGDGQIAVWQMNDLKVEAAFVVQQNPTLAWDLKGAGDLDGDGRAELIFQSASFDVVAWQLKETNGTLKMNGGQLITPPGAESMSGWSLCEVGDVNTDGFADLIFQNTDTTAIRVWEMNGFNVIAHNSAVGTAGTNWELIA